MVKFEQNIVTDFFFFFHLIFFEDGKGIWLESKICAQANREYGSAETCSPVAYCAEIQEN